jgi:uncharacterized protein YjlB
MDLEAWTAPPGDVIANHPRFPVLVYRGVAGIEDAGAARALLGRHGWGGSWVDGVFDFHHFHSTPRAGLLDDLAQGHCFAAGGVTYR